MRINNQIKTKGCVVANTTPFFLRQNLLSRSESMPLNKKATIYSIYYCTDGTFLGKYEADSIGVFVIPPNKYEQDFKRHLLIYKIRELKHLKDRNGVPIPYRDFKDIAGTVMREMDSSNYTEREAAAIYSVIKNRAIAKNQSEHWIAGNTGIFGWSHRNDIDNPSFKQKSKIAIAGVIKAIIDDFDYSNGAYFWQGRDFKMKDWNAYKNYYKTGFDFTDSIHDNWNLGDYKSGKKEYDFLYESTAFEGGTTFMRYTQEWKSAKKHPKNYP